jgi:hypothetical protein
LRTSSRIGLAASVALLGVAAVAQDRPESILPPGFGEPAPAATPRASATAADPGSARLPSDPVGAVVQPLPGATPSPIPTPSATPTPMDAAELARYEMPAFARRSLARIGVVDEVSPDAFGTADGRYLEALMRRTAAP